MKKKVIIPLSIIVVVLAVSIPIIIFVLVPLFKGADPKCTIKYQLYDDVSTTDQVIQGVSLGEPDDPTRENYSFVAWYLDEDLSTPYDFSTVINEDTTLYAKWQYAAMIDLEAKCNAMTESGVLTYFGRGSTLAEDELSGNVDLTNVTSVLYLMADSSMLIETNSIESAEALEASFASFLSEDELFRTFREGNIVGYCVSKMYFIDAYLFGTYGSNDDYKYLTYNNKSYIISYTGSDTTITLPSTLNGKNVIGIVNAAFADTDITEVTLSDTIKYIGNGAFSESKLVTLNSSEDSKLKSIDNSVFSRCYDLETVNFPSTVEEVGTDIFYSTGFLENQGDNPLYIGKVLYLYCGTAPANFTIREGITTINPEAFKDQSTLVSISLPSSMLKILNSAFYHCTSLNSVILNDSLEYIGSNAFEFCSSLEEIDIPATVEYIDSSAFYGCSSLAEINVDSENNAYHSTSGILYKGSILNIYPANKTGSTYYVNNGVTEISKWAFAYCQNLTSVTIPSTVTKIGDYAFSHCQNLSAISLPSTLTTLGESMFNNCTNLTSITLPSSLTSISSNLFAYAGLTSITIPSGVTIIENNAFYYCDDLTTIAFLSNNTLLEIQSDAFYGCTSLANIGYAYQSSGDTLYSMPSSIVSTGPRIFNSGNSGSNPEDLYIPWFNNQADGIVYVGKTLYAYKGTMPSDFSLDSGDILSDTKTICEDAFYYQSNLVSLVIPANVTYIGIDAFNGCTNLSSVIFEGTSELTTLDSGAFASCISLNGVVLPTSLIKINSRCFYGCRNMSGIIVPANVAYIGYYAFYSCGNNSGGLLLSVMATTPPTISELFSSGNYASTDTIIIYVPNEALALYQSDWAEYLSYIQGV